MNKNFVVEYDKLVLDGSSPSRVGKILEIEGQKIKDIVKSKSNAFSTKRMIYEELLIEMNKNLKATNPEFYCVLEKDEHSNNYELILKRK